MPVIPGTWHMPLIPVTWHMPVIPVTQEAEAGESLEPGSGGCNEPRSCHCTPTWATRVKLHLKRKEKKNGQNI